MKALLFSLLVTGSLLCQAEQPTKTYTALDTSEVRLPYGELRRLMEAAQKAELRPEAKPQNLPPISATVMSAMYEVDGKLGFVTASLHVEVFQAGWHSIPLVGGSSVVSRVEPANSRVAVLEDRLCLLTDQVGAQDLKLFFPLSVEGEKLVLHLVSAAVSALRVKELSEGQELKVQCEQATYLLKQGREIVLPAHGGKVSVSTSSNSGDKQLGDSHEMLDEAVIVEAQYTTQVVRDGSVLTDARLILKHDAPSKLILKMPTEARMLQCCVNGNVIRRAVTKGGSVEIPLEDPATDGAESEIVFSYTHSVAALQLSEGELDLALPQTVLFARQIDWKVNLPTQYDLSFSGNVDDAGSKERQVGAELHLRKSLSRDQQPQARIAYRKRDIQ